MLAHAYQDINQADRALRALESATRMAPDAGNFHNEYGYILLQAGRHAEALHQFEEYLRVSPREPNAQDSLAEAYLTLGDPEKALGVYDVAFRVHPGLYDFYHGRAWTFAMLGRYDEAIADSAAWVEGWIKADLPTTQPYLMKAYLLSRAGRYREMIAALAAARRESKRAANVEGDAGSDLIEAIVALEQRRLDAAIASADRVVALAPRIRGRARGLTRAAANLVGGTAEARSGRIAAARGRLDRARSELDAASHAERWLTGALAGEIALAAGASADALAAMRAADPEAALSFSIGNGMLVVLPNAMPMFDGLARALASSGEPAVDALRAAVTPKGRKWAAPLEPRFVLELARVLETTDKAASNAEYERFLKLWSRADEGAPELVEARRKLAARPARD
jgi:tetratricopeptide (TPR) repeat protein